MAETCSQILPNCNYCILFDVWSVLTVHNVLYKFDNTQRDGLSLFLKKEFAFTKYEGQKANQFYKQSTHPQVI